MVRAKPDPGEPDFDRVDVKMADGAEGYAVILVCPSRRGCTGDRPARPNKVGDVEAAVAAEVETRRPNHRLAVDVLHGRRDVGWSHPSGSMSRRASGVREDRRSAHKESRPTHDARQRCSHLRVGVQSSG